MNDSGSQSVSTQASIIRPWRTIWYKPRATVRALVDADRHGEGTAILYVGGGCSWTILNLMERDVDSTQINWARFIAPMAISPLAVAVSFFVGSHLFYWIGKSLGGTGTARNIRVGYRWGLAPMVVWTSIWLPSAVYVGKPLLAGDISALESSPAQMIVFLFTLMSGVLASLYSWILTIAGISEGHRFGAIQGCLTVFLLWIAMVVVFLVGIVLTAA